MAMAHSHRIEAPVVEGAMAGLGGRIGRQSGTLEPIAPSRNACFSTHLLYLPNDADAMLETTRTWIAPDLWTEEFTFLSKPGHSDIQRELLYDFPTKVGLLSNLASMDVAKSSLVC